LIQNFIKNATVKLGSVLNQLAIEGMC
jgi:hypothetical protein